MVQILSDLIQYIISKQGLTTNLRVGDKIRAFRIQDFYAYDRSFVLELYLLGKNR